VSEYIEGETLHTKLSKLEPGQALGVSETFNLLVKVSTILSILHSENHNGVGSRIVHGDLKAENIVLSDSGDPTLIDFGSVRAATPGQTERFTIKTSSKRSFTRGCATVEQYTGQAIPASDVYALGVVATRCLLGRIPDELRESVLRRQPFTVQHDATIPKPLAALLNKMLAFHSKDRYQNGQELLGALRQAESAVLAADRAQKVHAQKGTNQSLSSRSLVVGKITGAIVGTAGALLRRLPETWRRLTLPFTRGAQSQESVNAQTPQSSIDQPPPSPRTVELHNKWRELMEYRERVDRRIEDSPIEVVQAALEELKVKTQEYEPLNREHEQAFRGLLRGNFLGVEEWQKGFDVRIGRPPPIPVHITEELLHSECPLRPGKAIKDTHILLLLPQTVDGRPYNALELAKLCTSESIDPRWFGWKACEWASKSQQRTEWILIPTRDVDPEKVPPKRQFQNKTIAEQELVHAQFYRQDYREAKALEVMTAALLARATSGRHIYSDIFLRCAEPDAKGGRVCVGRFYSGLRIDIEEGDHKYGGYGRALVRKPRSQG
jgi:serine/threonine protein kinase